MEIIQSFDRRRAAKRGDYWNVWRPFAAEHVMRTFDCVHLRGRRCQQKQLPPDDDGGGGSGDSGTSIATLALAATADDDPCARCSDFATPYVRAFSTKASRKFFEERSRW